MLIVNTINFVAVVSYIAATKICSLFKTHALDALSYEKKGDQVT